MHNKLIWKLRTFKPIYPLPLFSAKTRSKFDVLFPVSSNMRYDVDVYFLISAYVSSVRNPDTTGQHTSRGLLFMYLWLLNMTKTHLLFLMFHSGASKCACEDENKVSLQPRDLGRDICARNPCWQCIDRAVAWDSWLVTKLALPVARIFLVVNRACALVVWMAECNYLKTFAISSLY